MKKIVRGNDFTLRVPVMKIVDGTKVAFPLPGCTDIKVNVVNQYRRIALSYTIDVSEDNVLLARVEGDKVAVGTYALEVKGKIFGNDWRSNEYEQFQIVDNNAAGDTVFEPQEGEDSVEMDTAIVVLAPAVELGNLIKDAEETIANTKEALKGVETKMGAIEQRADTAIGAATTAAERANTAAEKTEQTNAAVENAEKERVAAEQERKTAEEQRKSQMQSYAEAEKARADAEQHRVDAEKRRASAETMRAAAEETRKKDEADRITGETSREKQEDSRVTAEQTRDEQETSRKIDEKKRADAEIKRADAENTRKRMEADRAEAEVGRAAAETARADAEIKRAAAETERETNFSTKIAEVDTAVKNAKTATSEAENVDATITDANVLEVTGRDGVKKSLELASQAYAATIKKELAGKLDKASVAQELGEAEDKVMSQKVVSGKFSDLDNIIMGEYEYPTILSKKELKNGYYASNTSCKVCIYDITKVAGTTITLDVEGTSWNSIDYAIVKDYRKIAESQSEYNEEVWNANLLEVVTIQGGPITKAIDLSSESIVNAAKEGSIYLVCNLGLTYEATPLKKTIGLAENVEQLKEKQEYNIYPSKIDGKLAETSTNTGYYKGNLGTHTTDLLVYGVRMRNPYTKKMCSLRSMIYLVKHFQIYVQ